MEWRAECSKNAGETQYLCAHRCNYYFSVCGIFIYKIGETMYYGIEAGGTKFVCAWGTGPEDLHDRITIPTTTPTETLSRVIEHIRAVSTKTKLLGIGAAVFGPLGLNPEHDHFGYITSTPKLAWRYCNFVEELTKATALPIAFDTDVNVTAMGEYHWGNGHNISDFIYMTVGTGIGAGAFVNHRLCHGALHPEMGHILISKLANDTGKSVCAYHDTCLEGLASGPSLQARHQVDDAMKLDADHIAWEIEAHYLALALVNYTFCLSPKRIIIGGGVMQQVNLLKKIQQKVAPLIGGYVQHANLNDISNYIVSPGLKNNTGVLGAIALAKTTQKTEVAPCNSF